MAEEPNQQVEEKPTVDDFEEYFEANPNLTNIELYEKFPNTPKSTIRYWKKKVLDAQKPPETPTTDSPTPTEDERLKKAIELLKLQVKDPQIHAILEDLDLDNQYKVLIKAAKDKKPDPNIRLMTPIGSGKPKMGIEKYMTIDEKSFRKKGFGDVEIILPASVALNPEENKKLREHN